MLQPFTYLLINFFTIIICIIASFHAKIQFNKYFKPFIIAATIVGFVFVIWDAIFTKMGVWWFNTDYTININILGLPLEEILFFYCIPFSCVFTYFCFDKFFNWDWAVSFNNILTFVGVIICSVWALKYSDRIYPFITAIVTIITLLYLHFFAKAEWITQATIIYLILMLGFFPVNGVLTGTGLESPIVNYNPLNFMGIRMGTIPIEDAVYGYTLFLLNLYFFKIFSHQHSKNISAYEPQ